MEFGEILPTAEKVKETENFYNCRLNNDLYCKALFFNYVSIQFFTGKLKYSQIIFKAFLSIVNLRLQ